VLLFTTLEVSLCLIASVPIVLYDLRQHRITNSSLCRFGSAVFALRLAESFLGLNNFLGALLDGVSALVLFLAVYWISGRSMGLGDVKLALVLATLASPGTIRMFILWFSMIWIWGGVHAMTSAIRYRTIRRRIAFAPALFAGTLTYLAMGIWSSLPQ
jgi:prepilin signal peptidase PulO-like enzyme (type II secretory pathway)